MNKKQLGAEGERFVSEQLQHQNYTIVEMNWRTRFGELDIIAEKDNVLYIIEVRTRTLYESRESQYGEAIEAMTKAKVKKLYQLAHLYFYQQAVSKHTSYRVMFAPVSFHFETKKLYMGKLIML